MRPQQISSANVWSNSSEMDLYFSFSWTNSSSKRSTSFCNFCTDRSANSARASASLNYYQQHKIKGSKTNTYDSPVSARSSARSKSASTIANLRATSSYFLSASSAIIHSSADCDASSNLAVAILSRSSDRSKSSSIN
ncbi:hypothetical protein DERP_012736 [Dermatophagoides pteronyssinus]|uniref:Uncharacterized protein n=1 Tax=Dermatophagoides pteronyssinus TaxID=6956 RepID=A0ABQ8JQS5_DERPT|nr:hypothetical protein DERP_012736 [Dermatophagoides pteronyssinus]